MHHKYLIVDNSDRSSDPLVLTGCHNWSSSAELRNDENTLIVHDATIANIYYQEFSERFKHGRIIVDAPFCAIDYVTTKEDSTVTYDVTTNDHVPGTANLTILQNPVHGTATANTANLITYEPAQGFSGLDTIRYELCLTDNPALCDSSFMVVLVRPPASVASTTFPTVNIFPNPGDGRITVTASSPLQEIRVYSMTGTLLQVHRTNTHNNNTTPLNLALSKGMYLLELNTEKGVINKRIVIR